MKKLLALSTIIILASTPANALITQEPTDLGIASGDKNEGQEINGKKCTTVLVRANEKVRCSRVVITGTQDPTTDLNFHFIDERNIGIVYLTERKKRVRGKTEYYQITGWASEKNGVFGKINQPLYPELAFCTVNTNGYKVTCIQSDEEGNHWIVSGLK